ncbi:hypothetical protein BDY24DRAFT_401411 [Mrakia frigida]|uniref:isopenicillin N synthase family dioxygenase n=1 Tax=Mrakia frigida TaxID=29902 RepID=UPI003FCBF8CA
MSNRLLSRSLLSLSSKRSSSSSKVGGVLFLNSSKRSFSITSTSLGEFTIPVVDFGRFLNSKTQAEKEDAAKQVVDALVERGFMYLSNHGIPEEEIQATFKESAKFFELPLEVKDPLAWKDPRANRGWVAHGRERVTQSADPEEILKMRAQAPDYKESMEVGREMDPGGVAPKWKNEWPPAGVLDTYKPQILKFFDLNHKLQLEVMRSIALGLKLEESYFDDKCDEKFHNLRLLAYPSIPAKLIEGGGTRAGAHSDYGTVTLLHQDSVGGLQVQDPDTKIYHGATPIPGTIVVNVGDLLSRWSNNVLRSTLHRVVAPPLREMEKADGSGETEMATPSRQSIAFFSNPNAGTVISCLPTCIPEGGEPKYPPVTTEEYIVGRLSATYA